ncbi:MAG: rhomboid family intramembrane serine protease [Oleiphilaceae bacterium]|nr:rhomboid family intramembrane serine protease [Oleiphilaceae bacterium]
MLIIPAENTIDWKRPPWVTLGLMLACLLVFVFYQGADPRLMNAAIERYLEADLEKLEAPVYEAYLERQINVRGDTDRVRELQAFQQARAEENERWLSAMMLSDRAFYYYEQANQDLLWAPGPKARWQDSRPPIQTELIDQLSASRSGLVPADLTIYAPFTYQFLHGGWGHLIGNLVFLFLLGFTLEKALGRLRYLLAYLLCGACSAMVYTAFSVGSQVPLVGASGSISGLMGMYVAIYGLRKIRFFYFVGVYFDYFRAPALAMLPVWVGKEVYDYWFADATGVAYMAHAGGLVAGAALVLLFGRGWFQVREAFFEPEQEEQDQQFTQAYGQAMTSLGRMDFEIARRQFEGLWQRYPDRSILLEHLYQLAKLRPDLPAYRKRARALMLQALSGGQPERMVEVWREYLAQGESVEPLPPEDHNRILFSSLRQDDLKTAEKAFECLRRGSDRSLIDEACALLAEEFEKRQMAPKGRYYRQLLAAD